MGLDQYIYEVPNEDVEKYKKLRKEKAKLSIEFNGKMKNFATAFKKQFADEIGKLKNKLSEYEKKYDIMVEDDADDIAAKLYNGLEIAERGISHDRIEWFLFNEFALITLWDEDEDLKKQIKDEFLNYYINLVNEIYNKMKEADLMPERAKLIEMQEQLESIIDEINNMSLYVTQYSKNHEVHKWFVENVEWEIPSCESKLFSADKFRQMVKECSLSDIPSIDDDSKYYYFAW